MTERATDLYDVFISYSDADQEWVRRELLPRLEGAQVRYIDQFDFQLGLPKLNEVERAIAESRKTLLVLSPAYLASNWQQFDSLLVSSYGLNLGEWRAIPLIIKPCHDLPKRLAALVAINVDTDAAFAWERLVQALNPRNAAVGSSSDQPLERASNTDSAFKGSTPSSYVYNEEQTRFVGLGLVALAELMQSPDVRSSVVAFQADFEAACEQINVLAQYKRLHDLFQELENGYYLLYHDGKRVAIDEGAWEGVERVEPEVQGDIDELIGFARSATFASAESPWMHKLGRVQNDLRLAIEDYAVEKLKSTIRRLNEVLAREPSRINTQLVTAVRSLRLAALAKALRVVCNKLGPLQLEGAAKRQLEEFEHAVDALVRLNEGLTSLVDNHNALQSLDDTLRMAEEQIEHDADTLTDIWEDLKLTMQMIKSNSSGDWAPKLDACAADLERTLLLQNPVKVKRSFRAYRSQASRSFNQVDRDLLLLCEGLQKVGDPLGSVLRMIQHG